MLSFENRRKHVLMVISLLEEATKEMRPPMMTLIAQQYGKDPFLMLISCLLSLRARDSVTFGVSQQLFSKAKTPEQMLALNLPQLEKILYPLGFYKKKAILLHSVSNEIINRFNGKVPSTEKELLSINGVGRKTANLVLAEAFAIPAICVDTHVHQVSNRLGWVKTKTPLETEKELKNIVPQSKWIELNKLLVTWGQNICVPISPFCSKCVLAPICPKLGVSKIR